MEESNQSAVHDNTATADSTVTTTTNTNNTNTTSSDTLLNTNTTSVESNTTIDEKSNVEDKVVETEKTNESEIPEAYEDFKVGDGLEYNKEASEQFKVVAKELGLSQENAQKLVDYQSQNLKSAMDAQTKQQNEWKATAEKTHGKDGIEQANRALTTLAKPEFVEFLKSSGLGNHPEMIGVFKEVFAKIGESSFVSNNSNGSGIMRNDYSGIYKMDKSFKK